MWGLNLVRRQRSACPERSRGMGDLFGQIVNRNRGSLVVPGFVPERREGSNPIKSSEAKMPKGKFSLNGTAQSLTDSHDANVRLWQKVLKTLREIRKSLEEESDRLKKMQTASSATNRLAAATVGEILEHGETGLSALQQLVETMLAVAESKAPNFTAEPAKPPAEKIDAGAMKKFLHELRQIVSFVSRSEETSLEELMGHVRSFVKEKTLSAGAVHAFKNTLRAIREYLGITEEKMRLQGLDTEGLIRMFWERAEANEDDLDLLADLAKELTGDEKADREKIFAALAELKAKTNGNGSSVRADDPRIKLLTFVLEKLGLESKAGRQDVERTLNDLLLQVERVKALEDFRARTFVALVGADDPNATIEEVEKAIDLMKKKGGS